MSEPVPTGAEREASKKALEAAANDPSASPDPSIEEIWDAAWIAARDFSESVLVAERTRSENAEEKLAEAMREYDAAAHNCEAWSADCSRLEARSRELEDAYNAEHDRAARAERTLEILEGKLKGDPDGIGASEQARADEIRAALCGGDSEQ